VSVDPTKYEKDTKAICSFSGGKDSTAMLIRLVEEGYPLDEIVFFDTGWEWPQIYKHVKAVERYIKRPITILKPSKPFEWFMYEKPSAIGKGKGWPRFNLRWCTGEKQKVIQRYLRSRKPYVQYIGFTVDEAYRVKRYEGDKTRRFPLVAWGMTEADCLKLCRDRGFDFGNLYDHASSTSCWCCPLQPLNALRALYKYYPDMWARLLDMASRTPTPFKIGRCVQDGIYVKDIDARFKREIAEGIFEAKLAGKPKEAAV